MEDGFETLHGREQKKAPGYETRLLLADGTSFGEGAISVPSRLEDPADPLNAETLAKVHEIIIGKDILVPVEADDDGCGDGRGVKRIFQAVRSGLKHFKRSLNRSKVFGGGLMMGVSARIGLGTAEGGIKDVFAAEAEEFAEAGLTYGIHTAEGAPRGKSGCGAIDEAPANVSNAVKYRSEITDVITVLGDLIFDDKEAAGLASRLEGVFDNFAGYAKSTSTQVHSGEEIAQAAAEDEKVVKELDNGEGHREVAIVLNFVQGMTVNQKLVRKASGQAAQVFGVDIPRIIEIAEKRYADPEERTGAILSMLVYTLSTAVTLTDGSLPVYAIKPKA